MPNNIDEKAQCILAQTQNGEHDNQGKELQTGLPVSGEEEQPQGRAQEQIYDVWTIPGNKGKKGIIVFRVDEDEPLTSVPPEAEPQTNVPTSALPDQTPAADQGKSTWPAQAVICLYLLLIFACLNFQLYWIFHPPTATITIIPKSQQITVTGTLQIGRIITPITLSQTATAQTTGRGHQDATTAAGFITFYNGQLSAQTIPAGTILTGSEGVEIETSQDATIPALDATANPPTVGQVTVSAHAVNPGGSGNILAYDINEPCCLPSVIAKNTTSFHGGQNERDFQTVAQSDIDNAASTLKPAVSESMQGALAGQLKSGEALIIPKCTPTISTDHHTGEEAVQVKVTVAETCSAVAYNEQRLRIQATALLTARASKELGAGYRLLGDPRLTIQQATTNTTSVLRSSPIPPVTVSFSCAGRWVYAVTYAEQEHIKSLIAGKTLLEALHILESLPGIASASIDWDANTKLPKDSANIYFVIFVI